VVSDGVGVGVGGQAGAGRAGRARLGVSAQQVQAGPHARGTAGWGAHRRSVSSFFSSSSICRGRSRAVRHACGLGWGKERPPEKAAQEVVAGTGRATHAHERCGV